MSLNDKWYEIITGYPFLNMTSFFKVPYGDIIYDFKKMPNREKYLCTPRNQYERELITSVNVGENLGGNGFINPTGWKSFSIFNRTGKSHHTIVHDFLPSIDKIEYLECYRMIKKHKWTNVKKHFPSLQRWIQSTIKPCFHLAFVRFMILKPGGIIPPHNDIPQEVLGIHKRNRIASYNMLNSINISLFQKPGNVFCLDNKLINFKPGGAYWVNVGKKHWVVNMSDEDRIHLQIHGLYKRSYRKYVVENIESIKKNTVLDK
ncbi:MAG: aspartyl/asparaginyl beta-hydroxylase domain-containing protein [Oligoflexia bacterium]|nr:aspartyl/asparaginyl beta-hydroxylase domain-containing protein [Oligoflexia bacterium]